MHPFQTINLNEGSGTQFAYLDSGAPPGISTYTTIFVIHGMCYTSCVFQKVLDLAPSSSIRIVAINRRDYLPSSPLAPEDVALITGNEDDKARYLSDRGVEILQFIDQFVQRNQLPEISEEVGLKKGGVALLGWSVGASFALSALASASKLEIEAQVRLSKYLRSLILEGPTTFSLGKPWPEGGWLPSMNPLIPISEVVPLTNQWITGYFEHPGAIGDPYLRRRDIKSLSSVLASSSKVPSIYSMPYSQVIDESAMKQSGSSDRLHVSGSLGEQLKECYEKALFGKEVKRVFPHLKRSVIARAQATVVCIVAAWEIQKDDETRGGGYVDCRIVPDTNAFVHWDSPQLAIDSWKEAMA